MKALITGSLGFVGGYLRKELEQNGYEVIGIDVREAEQTICCDLLNAEYTLKVVSAIQPDVVFHLAGQADVGKSWKIPQKTIELNVLAAVNMMEAVRISCPDSRVLLVGSADEYGRLGAAGENVTEETPVQPQSPYAVSKLAQEDMARVFVKAYGMHICMTRSFNHCGAGQKEGFIIPDFASGIARVEKGIIHAMRVGNLESRRDFTHVRDVVHAYRLIMEKGRSGEIYNVGSGTTYSAQEILDKLLSMSFCDIPVEQDPMKMRPSDTPVICCNHDKLTNDTGWEPFIGMDSILSEVLSEWRSKA